MSSRVIYNEPVSATEHDATPDSPGQTDFGANRQGNGITGKSAQRPVITCGKSKEEATGFILAANGDSDPQKPDHCSTETVTTSTIDKPAITIPSMNQLNSQSTSASAVQTPVSATSSRRSSNHATSLISSLTPTRPAPPSPISNPPSRRGSKTLGISLSNTSSPTYSPQRSPSHKLSTSSIRKNGVGDGSRPNVVRRQSSLAITYTASPSITPIDREKEADARELIQVDGASSTASPASTAAEPVSAASVAHKILDPLSAMNPPKPKSGTTTSTPPTAPTTSNTDSPLRRNFSSTSASTSGASTTTSDSSNPVLRHATELELAYGIIPSTQNSTSTPAAGSTTSSRIPRSGSGLSGTHTPFSTGARSVIQSLRGNRMRNAEPEVDDSNNAEPDGTGFADLNPHDNVSNLPPPKDASEEECADIAWALAHTVIVKDFGFEEGDERFDKVPDEALLGVLRPPKATSEATGKVTGSGFGLANGMGRAGFRSAKSGRSSGRGAHYGGAADYGGRWPAGEETFEEDEDLDDEDEDDEEEEDDGWGFPMGTVSGGPAPLGTTLLGSRRELKNRVRAWSGLGGSKGVGGRWVAEESSEAEGESSGFYEEGEGVSGGEGISGDDGEEMDPKDGDDDGLELDAFALMHTPGRAYRNFIGDEGHISGSVEPSTYHSNSTSAYISGSQLVPAGHIDVDGVDADDDEGDSTDSDDTDRDRDHSGEDVKPGVYRALFAFEAEGSAEMSVVEGQMVRVVGGSRDGWAIAERTTHKAGGARASAGAVFDVLGEEHGLVPLSYLEVSELDGDGDL